MWYPYFLPRSKQPETDCSSTGNPQKSLYRASPVISGHVEWPDITGSFTGGDSQTYSSNPSSSGAFSDGSVSPVQFQGGHSNVFQQKRFSASKSNTIYGKSPSVQPSSVRLLPLIKAWSREEDGAKKAEQHQKNRKEYYFFSPEKHTLYFGSLVPHSSSLFLCFLCDKKPHFHRIYC